MCDTLAMYITNIETDGPFLKIWGQVDKNAAIDVERALYKAYTMYEDGKHLLTPGNLLIGALCCAKYIDEKYYRARITNIDARCQGTVEVNFIDYGNRDLVPIANLRSMDCFNSTFITLPPLALPFILSEVVCVGGEWNEMNLEQISREIRYMEVKYKIISTHLGYQIILVYLADRDLAVHLVQNSLMQSIPLETQESLLSKMIPRTPQAMPPADQSLLQYKSVTLEPNSRHEVYVSYITDGPCHFSVQLKKSESILVQLMREINSIPLKPFEELPIPGTVCLAKCVEDSHICRAVITSEVDTQYKLFYVDFGNTEIVPPDNLYQMPFKYIIPKIMAIRLSLDGIDKSTVTLEMQCAFKQFVDNRLLMMEVFPSAKKMALPKCRMWDPETNTDVMEILNKAAQLAYPNAIPLHRGFTRPVKVTFVYSCNKFYIHLKSNEDELGQLMANIQVYCNSTTSSFLEEPRIGQPCCAQFQHDGQWYRSLIVALNEDSAKVKYIDYGNEEDVHMQLLKTIEGEFLTCMRPQAIECCLNGYQNMTEDLERDNKLEELILDQEFTMKVLDIVNGKSLVDLIDSQGGSVTTLLMEAMINQTKVQVVANGNIENTTTRYDNANPSRRNGKPYGEEQWPSRDKSQNRKETSEDWRQGSRKRNGSVSNESTESSSWRHKNNKNHSEWHDNTSNESFRKGRTNNESRKSANTKNQNNTWSPPEKDSSQNQNNYSNPQTSHAEWNGRGTNNGRNRSSSFRQDNEGFGNKENRNRQKNDNFNTDNSTTWGDNEEFQGVKKRTKNFSSNNSNNRNRDRTDNDEWGSKKNSFNGNDFGEKKSYRERNSYDSDNSGSYKRGKSERSFDGKPRFDRGDNRKKPFRKGDDYHMGDHEQTDGRKFNSRSDSKWTERNNRNESRSNSYNNATTAIDAAPDDATFQTLEVNGRQKVTLSWFHNPFSFFCQLMDSQQNFNTLMDEIQEMYKDKPSGFAVEGAPAIALFPEDNVFYRSRVLKSIGNKYKVYYVDFGNISVVDSVWPIDKKFMELPMQAIPCGLGGIQPVGNDWPDPNAFVNYMQKNSLDCEFQSYQIDRYMVNLYSDDQDIKQQLVDDNLAKYVEISVPSLDFDINFLTGHTFRAMLESVNDLSDFRMSLSSGIQLLCSAHNLTSATEIFEDELKQKVGQVVVVYGDNVIEDRLEVTLYDHMGNKLNILNPDEGAFDSIESVCPYLLIQSKVEGFVSFVNETSIVIQPTECTELIESLLNDIYEHYECLPQENPIIPEEGFLYAVLSDDSNWYRGRVTSFDDEKVTVMYIDYGNSEDVPFANLRELDPKFYWWDRMAILVEVNVPTADLLEKKVTALVRYGDIGLEGEILDVEAPCVSKEEQQPEFSNVNPDAHISDQITEETTDMPISIENETTQIESFHNEENTSGEPTVDGTAVIISHIDSPSDFYIQLVESQNAIGELQSKIQEQIEEMSVLENTSIGGLCAAPYSVDQMWYRSQILDADEDITTVRFIDYGSTDVIDNKATQIKTLPAEFLALEEYARRCRLKIKPLEEEWSKPTTDRFEELVYAESVTVQFINQDEKVNYVELFSDGQNVKDLLIAENLAVLDEDMVLDAKLKGYISHMNSPSEFWVQLDGWCAELEWIAEQLSNASSFPDLEDFTPGSLCAAMFPEDEMWYRARILSNTVAGLDVLFLDYGNSCVCGNLKQLPEHLVMAPPLALKCSLQKPEGILNWSPEAVQKFADLSADGQTEFTLKKLTTGETAMVELYVNNEEVSSMLLPTTDDVYVTEIKSMGDFATLKDGAISEERYRLENIPGCEYNEECLSKFVEINNEGKTLYGMEFLSENTVRLYVNGNDIRKEFLAILKEKSQSPVVKFDVAELENSELAGVSVASQTNEHKTRGVSNTSEDVCESLQAKELEKTVEACDTSQINEIHEVLQGEISQMNDILQQNEILEELQEKVSEVCEITLDEEQTDLGEAAELCFTPKTNEKITEVCVISQVEQNLEVLQGETLQKKDICEQSEEGTSGRYDVTEQKEILEISQDDDPGEIISEVNTKAIKTNEISVTNQEGASEVFNRSQAEDIHEVSQAEATEVYETVQEEGCDTSQSNASHEHSEDDSQIDETIQKAEILEESQIKSSEPCEIPVNEKDLEEASKHCYTNEIQETVTEICGTSQVDENHEVLQGESTKAMVHEVHEQCEEESSEIQEEYQIETSCDTPEGKMNQVDLEDPTESNYIQETIQEVASHTSQEEKIRELSHKDTPLQDREIDEESDQEGATEFCDNPHEGHVEASQPCIISLVKDSCGAEQKSPKACDIVQITEGFEENIEAETQVCDIFQTSENHDIDNKEISQNCDATESKEITEDETQENTGIHKEAEKDESCDKQIIISNIDKDTEVSSNDDQVCNREATMQQTKENDELLLEENAEEVYIPTSKEIGGIYGENDEQEVSEGASEVCDTCHSKEMNDLVQEIASEVCDTLFENVQEEINRVDKYSDSCDKQKTEAVSAEVRDIPKHSVPIDSSEETEYTKPTLKVEFTETIMTSFSAPTVSEKESVPKLSPTKVAPKVQEGSGEDTISDSPKLEG